MRIIRTLLVVTGGLFLLPSPPEGESAGDQEPAAFELVGSAMRAASDAAAFCDRQPGVCETAGYVAGKLEAKAKYSVRLLYEWANEAGQDGAALPQGQTADHIITGSTARVAAQSTLTIEDLIPEWRGPAPG
jgi:hypothetical protein